MTQRLANARCNHPASLSVRLDKLCHVWKPSGQPIRSTDRLTRIS